MPYIYQRKGWPKLIWKRQQLLDQLARVRHRQGRLVGRMEGLGFSLRNEAILQTLTQDVMKTSEIEGEKLDRDQVRSSIAQRLGIDIGGLTHADRHTEGVVEMMLDATQRYAEPLTDERLFGWHAALFPAGRSGMNKITVGNWRRDETGPMQVISGAIGKEKVHFEAPPAKRVPKEMKAFLAWFNRFKDNDPVIAAGLAHLWFVTIHPFEDGNGRIARAIADMALARSEDSAQRFYSMSAQIQKERNSYYDRLETIQKGNLDVTAWLEWFLACLERAFDDADDTLRNILHKSRFWDAHRATLLNERQRAMINRLFDGFDGKLTTSKWAKITKSSQDTALRDIEGLLKLEILIKEAAGGRSTSYTLAKGYKASNTPSK